MRVHVCVHVPGYMYVCMCTLATVVPVYRVPVQVLVLTYIVQVHTFMYVHVHTFMYK